jgi:hypothetical protein
MHSKITELQETGEIMKNNIKTLKEENKMSLDKINAQTITIDKLSMEKEMLSKQVVELKADNDKIDIQLKTENAGKKRKGKGKACDCRII